MIHIVVGGVNTVRTKKINLLIITNAKHIVAHMYTLRKYTRGVAKHKLYYLPFLVFDDRYGYHYQFFQLSRLKRTNASDKTITVVFKDDDKTVTNVNENAIVQIPTISEKGVNYKLLSMPYPARRRSATNDEIKDAWNQVYQMYPKQQKTYIPNFSKFKKPPTVFYIPRISGSDGDNGEEWQTGDNERMSSAGYTWEPVVMALKGIQKCVMNPITNQMYSLKDYKEDLMVFVSDKKLQDEKKLKVKKKKYDHTYFTDMYINETCKIQIQIQKPRTQKLRTQKLRYILPPP